MVVRDAVDHDGVVLGRQSAAAVGRGGDVVAAAVRDGDAAGVEDRDDVAAHLKIYELLRHKKEI